MRLEMEIRRRKEIEDPVEQLSEMCRCVGCGADDHDHGATRPCWSEKEKSNAVTDIEIAEKSSSGREPRPGKG